MLADPFKPKYKTPAELSRLTPEALVEYKKYLNRQSLWLLEVAKNWRDTYRATTLELKDRENQLAVELEMAYLDRIESNGLDYGSLCNIH